MSSASSAAVYGLARSLVMYYGVLPFRLGRLRRFYAMFIRPGDLCFDVGAHAGSRTLVWAGLGAQIVAVEPQPLFMRFLRRWFGRHPEITLLELALGAMPGEQTLLISQHTPTVTSLSPAWIASVRRVPSFAWINWDQAVRVQVSTLDALVGQFGLPAFCKIDVEGYELEVLRGLSRPIPRLSFELIPAAKELALGCVDRLDGLGSYEYNYAAGESLRLWDAWVNGAEIAAWVSSLPLAAASGDIYAQLKDPP